MYRHPRNVSRKFEKASSSRTGDIHCYHNISKEVRQWTDWQTYKKSEIILNRCRNIQSMSPENLKKDSSSRTGDIQRKPNFSKEVRQWTDWQTYKKFEIPWNYCKNIPGVSPKDFRKISLPEPDILTSWVSGDRRTHPPMKTAPPWVDPPPSPGGQPKNVSLCVSVHHADFSGMLCL